MTSNTSGNEIPISKSQDFSRPEHISIESKAGNLDGREVKEQKGLLGKIKDKWDNLPPLVKTGIKVAAVAAVAFALIAGGILMAGAAAALFTAIPMSTIFAAGALVVGLSALTTFPVLTASGLIIAFAPEGADENAIPPNQLQDLKNSYNDPKTSFKDFQEAHLSGGKFKKLKPLLKEDVADRLKELIVKQKELNGKEAMLEAKPKLEEKIKELKAKLESLNPPNPPIDEKITDLQKELRGKQEALNDEKTTDTEKTKIEEEIKNLKEQITSLLPPRQTISLEASGQISEIDGQLQGKLKYLANLNEIESSLENITTGWHALRNAYPNGDNLFKPQPAPVQENE